MNRRIVAFDQDAEGDWRAMLECGHYQHVRHNPPLISRLWVLTEDGRKSRLGMMLNCLICDDRLAGMPLTQEDVDRAAS